MSVTLNSPNALLLLAIQAQLAAISLPGSPTGALGTIDQDLGQLEDGSIRTPASWPCALIDIEDVVFSNTGANGQLGKGTVCIRLGFPPFSSTSFITPAPYRNKALYYYEIEQAVYMAFQGWAPSVITVDNTTDPVTTANIGDIWGAFMRIRAVTERRNDVTRVRCIYFQISGDDYSATPLGIIYDDPTITITETLAT